MFSIGIADQNTTKDLDAGKANDVSNVEGNSENSSAKVSGLIPATRFRGLKSNFIFSLKSPNLYLGDKTRSSRVDPKIPMLGSRIIYQSLKKLPQKYRAH